MGSRPNIHRYMLEFCRIAATRSTCVRRAVGAVITDEEGHILSTGYNGVARKRPHCTDQPCPGASDASGDNSRCEAIHAETNAILHMTDRRFAYAMYCTVTPCFNCAKLILATPIKRVIVQDVYTDTKGYNLLLEAGVPVYQYTDESLYHGEDIPKDRRGLKML